MSVVYKKKCDDCGETRLSTDFDWNSNAGAIANRCLFCERPANRDVSIAGTRLKMKFARDLKARLIDELFTVKACVKCGGPWTDCDHRDPSTKKYQMNSSMRTGTFASIVSVKNGEVVNADFIEAEMRAELLKCDLICRPCHIEKTRNDETDRRKPNRRTEALFSNAIAKAVKHAPKLRPEMLYMIEEAQTALGLAGVKAMKKTRRARRKMAESSDHEAQRSLNG